MSTALVSLARTRASRVLWPRLATSLLLGLVVLANLAHARPADPPPRADPDHHTLVHHGRSRQYLLRLPPGKPAAGGWPLVVVFHGGGGNAFNAERTTGFTELGQRQGFAVLYPDGTPGLGSRLLTWNAVHCCGPAMRNGVDDVGFVGALLDELQKKYPVDAHRIYATGLSNGGMMVHRVAAGMPQRWAAIAPVIATLFGDEPLPVQPVAALIINGERDLSVPVSGGQPGGRFADAWSGQPLKPISSQSRFWAEANACQVGPDKQYTATHVRWRYRCPEGQEVERVLVTGMGHAWPGGRSAGPRADDPASPFDATREIWRFFSQHRRP